MTQPTASNILVEVIEGDSRLWPGFEIDILAWDGEPAEYEQEAGMLEDAIAESFQPGRVGTFYLYGFSAFYSKDHYGEVDADYELEGWREATPQDINSFPVSTEEEEANG